jgi:hypothetical protein
MSTATLRSLVIPNGAAVSNELDIQAVESLGIVAPGTLDGATTFTIEVAADRAGATWGTLTKEDGTDITLAAAKATTVNTAPYRSVRIKSSGNVAAARTFAVSAHERGL